MELNELRRTRDVNKAVNGKTKTNSKSARLETKTNTETSKRTVNLTLSAPFTTERRFR